MLAAYLRGLLKPAFPNGLRSQVREELILRAVASEIDADYAMHENLVYSSLVKNPQRSMFTEMNRSLHNVYEKVSFSNPKTDKANAERANFVEVYKLLRDKGILDKVTEDKECKEVVIHH